MGVRFDRDQLSLVTEPDAPPALVEYIFGVVKAAVVQVSFEATEQNLHAIASVIANTLTDLVNLGRVYKLPLGGWAFDRAKVSTEVDPHEDVYVEDFRGIVDKSGIN